MASKNKLYVGDNLNVLLGMNSNTVDLIYLDPPFNSKRIYRAPIGTPAGEKSAGFDDIWVWGEDVDIRLESFLEMHPNLFGYIGVIGKIHGLAMQAYLTFMAQRIIEMHRVLKPTGSLYLHCDPTASHYLKVILDEVFGKNNFRNEIIWSYRTGGASSRRFSRKHDVLFLYAKNTREVFFKSLTEKSYTQSPSRRAGTVNYGGGTAEFHEDERGVYTIVNMRDVWEISYVGSTSPERTGYPTQKPLALLRRIVEASSREGDIVMDPFCGCATTCVAAQQMHRNWIGVDVSDVAVELVTDRLSRDGDQYVLFKDFVALKTPPVRTDLEKSSLGKKEMKKKLFGEQAGLCNGCKKTFDYVNLEMDHIIPRNKHGGNHPQNMQLLCGSCNRIKGDRPMEYLKLRLRTLQRDTQFY